MAKRARELRLEELKQEEDKMPSRKQIKMTPLTPSIAFNSKTSVKSTLPLPNISSDKKLEPILNWKDVKSSSEYITWKRKDKQNPKLVGEGKRKAISFLLAPFVVKDSHLSPTGNLDLVGELSKARFSIDLGKGIPDKLRDWCKQQNISKQQEECQEFLKNLVDDGLTYAWKFDLWNKCCDEEDGGVLQDFLNEAHSAWYKQYTNSEGIDEEYINLKRYLNTYDGKPNKPILWKKDKDGEYKEYVTEVLPEGSLVQVEASVRFYNIEGDDGMYGSSLDIGNNIIVIYVPPKTTHTDDIPYIEF